VHLRPGGQLLLSASGVSDSINAGYARLYADDFPLTGEWLEKADRPWPRATITPTSG
jgi:hypothetical protein